MPRAVTDYPEQASPAADANSDNDDDDNNDDDNDDNDNDNDNTNRSKPYTEEEDATIATAVQDHFNNLNADEDGKQPKWSKLVEERLPGRTAKRVRERWTNHLNPALDFGGFTKADDVRLHEGHKTHGPKWKVISDACFLGTRSGNNLKNRFNSLAYKELVADEFPKDAYFDDDDDEEEEEEEVDDDENAGGDGGSDGDGELPLAMLPPPNEKNEEDDEGDAAKKEEDDEKDDDEGDADENIENPDSDDNVDVEDAANEKKSPPSDDEKDPDETEDNLEDVDEPNEKEEDDDNEKKIEIPPTDDRMDVEDTEKEKDDDDEKKNGILTSAGKMDNEDIEDDRKDAEKPFSRDDDLRLIEAYQMLGTEWKEINEKYFDGKRLEEELQNRWNDAKYRALKAKGFPIDAYDDDASDGEGNKKNEEEKAANDGDDDTDDVMAMPSSPMRSPSPMNIDGKEEKEQETKVASPGKDTVSKDNEEKEKKEVDAEGNSSDHGDTGEAASEATKEGSEKATVEDIDEKEKKEEVKAEKEVSDGDKTEEKVVPDDASEGQSNKTDEKEAKTSDTAEAAQSPSEAATEEGSDDKKNTEIKVHEDVKDSASDGQSKSSTEKEMTEAASAISQAKDANKEEERKGSSASSTPALAQESVNVKIIDLVDEDKDEDEAKFKADVEKDDSVSNKTTEEKAATATASTPKKKDKSSSTNQKSGVKDQDVSSKHSRPLEQQNMATGLKQQQQLIDRNLQQRLRVMTAAEQQMIISQQQHMQMMAAMDAQMMQMQAGQGAPGTMQPPHMGTVAARNAQMMQYAQQYPPHPSMMQYGQPPQSPHHMNPMQQLQQGMMMNPMLVQQPQNEAPANGTVKDNVAPQQQQPSNKNTKYAATSQQKITVNMLSDSSNNCINLTITLPPPPAKLGILLDDNKVYSVPELISVAPSSPIRDQIPKEFRKNCCIASIKSDVIGHVRPTTAAQCAKLISQCQKASERKLKSKKGNGDDDEMSQKVGMTMEIVLVQISKKKKQTKKDELSTGNDNTGKSSPIEILDDEEGDEARLDQKLQLEAERVVEAAKLSLSTKKRKEDLQLEFRSTGMSKKMKQSPVSLGGPLPTHAPTQTPLIDPYQMATMNAHMMQWRQHNLMLMQETNPNPDGVDYGQMVQIPIIISLPRPQVKLGILLDDNIAQGMPQLKSVGSNSPIRNQIPPPLHSNCFIASLCSEHIGGLVRPKTAKEVATLISKCQEEGWIKADCRSIKRGEQLKQEKPPKLEMVLMQMPAGNAAAAAGQTPLHHNMYDGAKLRQVTATEQQRQKKKASAEPETVQPKRKKRGPMTDEERFESLKQRKAALLDFFSDESKPSFITFCRERGHVDSMRSILYRVVRSEKRLEWLMDRRDKANHRAEAYEIIEKMLPDQTQELIEYERSKKMALLDFFSNASKSTLDVFIKDKKLYRIRDALEQIIEGNKTLKWLVDKRDNPDARADAFGIIEKMLPDADERIVKEASEKHEFDRELKTTLIDFVSDSDGTSLGLFCAELKLEQKSEDKMRGAMSRFIDKDKRLRLLVDNRGIAARREEAFHLIEKLMPMTYTKYSNRTNLGDQPKGEDKLPSSSGSVHNYTKSKSLVHEEFFNPENIKQVADKLDFDVCPRMTRDNSKEITLHDRKHPDELLILLIFDLSNRVVKGRAVSLRDRNATLSNSTKILFYDHGYKKVGGVSNLEQTWVKRLEDAYVTGADTTPLDRLYKGKDSYTDAVERQHPGMLKKLYAHAEEMLGRECSEKEKAMFMNEKSMEDAHDDPMSPVLNLEKHHLLRWVKQQKLGGNSTKEVFGKEKQPSDENDLSIAQIEKRHSGLIEEFYNFAVEAVGSDASHHILATCMNERAKEYHEENPTMPLVTMSKVTLAGWLKKRSI